MIKRDMKNYYVYLHKRKGTDKIFYIGKGTNHRMFSEKNRNYLWEAVVRNDGGFDVEIYKDNLEVELIEKIGINNLTNLTEGGVGGDTLSNHPNLKEIGKKISEKHMGAGNPNYSKGYYYWWVKKYGKEKADEMESILRKNLSLKLKGRKLPPRPDVLGERNPAKRDDVRAKISNFAKNRIRKKVVCEYCGIELSDTHIKRHQRGKNCKK
jgi:hypothetical protein